MIVAVMLALAASSVSGVVHDSSGAVVPGAVVIVRLPDGSERRAVTGPGATSTQRIRTDERELIVVREATCYRTKHDSGMLRRVPSMLAAR